MFICIFKKKKRLQRRLSFRPPPNKVRGDLYCAPGNCFFRRSTPKGINGPPSLPPDKTQGRKKCRSFVYPIGTTTGSADVGVACVCTVPEKSHAPPEIPGYSGSNAALTSGENRAPQVTVWVTVECARTLASSTFFSDASLSSTPLFFRRRGANLTNVMCTTTTTIRTTT
eukprot:GEMP01091517.1.p1 GENE.GEMP01091517.1~~GEMP01091517.1.p1  ORF type:complete len:170 (+),score=13.27 GEMP01091517.1:348-857(+)